MSGFSSCMKKKMIFFKRKTRTVRGSDYSPAIELSEQIDKLVAATVTGETEKYSDEQANNVWTHKFCLLILYEQTTEF